MINLTNKEEYAYAADECADINSAAAYREGGIECPLCKDKGFVAKPQWHRISCYAVIEKCSCVNRNAKRVEEAEFTIYDFMAERKMGYYKAKKILEKACEQGEVLSIGQNKYRKLKEGA
jgi:hypothetical protein